MLGILSTMGVTNRNYELIDLYSGSGYSGVSSLPNTMQGIQTWTIIAFILAIVGAFLVHFLFVKAKNDPKNKFLMWLKDFLAFKTMWLETILKVAYYFLTIFCVLFSFNFLAAGGDGVLAWLLMMVLGPVFIRVVYEATMMFIMIWRNTRDIAKNTEPKNS